MSSLAMPLVIIKEEVIGRITDPANNLLLAGTVLANNLLLAGTVPANNSILKFKINDQTITSFLINKCIHS